MHLSPTASAFTPRFARDAFGAMERSQYAKDREAEAARTQMSYLTATSVPETPGLEGAFTRNSPPRFGPIARPKAVPAPLPMMYCQFGYFDRENRSRAFAIEGAPTDMPYLSIANLFDVSVVFADI